MITLASIVAFVLIRKRGGSKMVTPEEQREEKKIDSCQTLQLD